MMSVRRFTRRGFLRGVGLASAALGTGKHATIPAEAQARQQTNRELRLSQYPDEHFRLRTQPIKWPNNARIAVCWPVNFEGFTDTANSYDLAYHDYSCKAGFW